MATLKGSMALLPKGGPLVPLPLECHCKSTIVACVADSLRVCNTVAETQTKILVQIFTQKNASLILPAALVSPCLQHFHTVAETQMKI